MKIHKNIQQGTDEWFEIRKLKGTGSKATAIKTCDTGLDTLARELVLSSKIESDEERFINEDIERGNSLEDEARTIYEFETGQSVEQIGFVENGKYSGCSPDGFVGEDGGIEIKCINNKKYFNYLIDGIVIESTHMNQMQFCMWVTGRKWWDYVLYNPNFPKTLLVKRVESNEEMFAKFEKGIEKLEELINKYTKIYESK